MSTNNPVDDSDSQAVKSTLFTTIKNKLVEHYLGVFLTLMTAASGASAIKANSAAKSLADVSMYIQELEITSDKIKHDALRMNTALNNIGELAKLNTTLNNNFTEIKSKQKQLENALNHYSGEFWASHNTLAIKDEEQKRKLFEISQEFTKLLAAVNSIDNALFISGKYAPLIEATNTQLIRELKNLNAYFANDQVNLVEYKVFDKNTRLLTHQRR
ncbi:hypothetical protein [Thalassomonas sp. RHCl1]|uniref:hypothetical protein n=1 Tax=Thalassomonas sp. RHCl1 TaxID=2995320 RepID=UPI00248CEE52|nr:hypothetical protein [Thalassomonas sp. RHCl1]